MSGYEVEIKAWCDDHAALRRELERRGAQRRSRLREADRYYNHPSRDFGVTDEALRLRVVDDGAGPRSRVTYKGPKVSERSKTRLEEELGVDDGTALARVLECLGFREYGTVVKEREIWEFDGTTVCLDHVPGLGDFVELERQSDEWQAAEGELLALARELGLTRMEKRSYLELTRPV